MTGEKAAPEQLVLDLPHRAALGAEDFMVSPANASAIAVVDRWPEWASPAILVAGPEGAGKTHLAQVWRARSGAACVSSGSLDDAAIGALEQCGALVVEDVDRGVASERLLFHLLNLAREKQSSLLLTSRSAPGEIAIALPDLRSRLRALPVANLEPPDEALLRAVLVKLFSDRQLLVEPAVVAYIALRLERSLTAANRVVAVADRLALSQQRRVSRSLAAEALGMVGADGGEADGDDGRN